MASLWREHSCKQSLQLLYLWKEALKCELIVVSQNELRKVHTSLGDAAKCSQKKKTGMPAFHWFLVFFVWNSWVSGPAQNSLSLSPPPLSKQGRLYVILHEGSESSELCCWLHDTLACSRIMFKVLSFCDWFLQRRSFYRLVFVGERVHEQVMIVEYGWVHPAISFICECFWFVIFKSSKLYVYISTVRNKYQLARWHIVVLARSLHLNLQLCCDIIV